VDNAGSSQPNTGRQSKGRRMTWKKWLVLLLVVALIVGGAYLAYRYKQLKEENDRLSNPAEVAKVATAKLVADVAQLTELPTGETPTIATVSDASKLKNQAFFAKAQNGDKVLIYTQAKRAYLYRPSTDKIIEIAPINLGNSQNSSSYN